MPSLPISCSVTQCVLLALLSTVLASYARARSLDSDPNPHTDAKRFYIPVIISSDAILDSLKDKQQPRGPAESSVLLKNSNGLERKRTARLEYLDSLMPRSVEPKRQMFWSPLGYMSASARRLNQNTAGSRAPSSKEDAGSPGFRYG